MYSHFRDTTLVQVNPGFFEKIIHGKRRVEHSRFFSDVNGKNVVDFVRRIIVPDAVIEDAKNIVTACGRNFDVVPLSRSRL